MRRILLIVAAFALVALPVRSHAEKQRGVDRFWFTPAPGSIDMVRLFEAPEEWALARELVDVFKFYAPQTWHVPADENGPNTYEAFRRVEAFRKLAGWGIRIGIEAGAVKEHYCTADGSGMQAAIADTLESLDNVAAAGGVVSYVAMDEPFTAGLSPRCGGPSLVPTADRLAVYVTAVRRAYPFVRIGLIEPYPTFRPAQFRQMLELLEARGIRLDFLHVDPLKPPPSGERDRFGSEMIELGRLAGDHALIFGAIIWGDKGNSDAEYADDAMRAARNLKNVFRAWEVVPQHIVVQSWVASATGQKITPSNLPDSAPYTHTSLILQIYDLLKNVRIPRPR
jgi:hypothetical protein